MGKGKAPKAPDPQKLALMQNKLNLSSASLGQMLSMVDQEGPDGSLTYTQSGYRDYVDPFSGQTMKIPNYVQTMKLSDAQQQIKDRNNAARGNVAGILERLTGRLSGTLDKPFSLDNAETENSIVDRYGVRMGDRFKRQEAALDAKLAAQGITPGSTAYSRAMQGLGEERNDAWNQLLIDARSQAVNEKLMQRNQAYNELNALQTGAQINDPSQRQTPGAQVATPDYMGAAYQSHQSDMNAWQQKQNMLGSIGGMFGTVGTALASNPEFIAMLSDRRAKADVKRVGKTDDGQTVYAFRYKGDKRTHLGLMAQEVEKKTPEAVITLPSGLKAVDYNKALHLGG